MKALEKEKEKKKDISEQPSDNETPQPDGLPKKRGRKREKDEEYFERAQQKIEEIKARLKTAKKDGMDVKERQRLRNQVSAQQSRIKKKEEVIQLKKLIRIKNHNLS